LTTHFSISRSWLQYINSPRLHILTYFNKMYSPSFDPGELPQIDVDPVTGAPLSRRASSNYGRRLSGSYVGVPVPVPVPTGTLTPNSPYAYSPNNYFASSPYGSPYLSPGSLPSPQLVPHSWVNAYYDQFGERIPISAGDRYEHSPRRRNIQLASPNASPYLNVIPLPIISDEPEYLDPRESWATRFKNWITGENSSDPHRQLNRTIQINAAFNYKDSGVQWNMCFSPHTVRLRRLVNPDGSAFSPPLTSCRIVTPLIPWVLEIRARDGADFITNMSLLTDIYRYFKKSIDREVYNRLPAPFRVLVDEAYRERCSMIPDEDASSVAFSQGIRRIDFLLDKQLFIGLSQVKDMYSTFELHLTTVA